MVINMGANASEADVQHVIERVKECGFQPHVTRGTEWVIVAAVGSGGNRSSLEALKPAPGVEDAVRIAHTCRPVRRKLKDHCTYVRVGARNMQNYALLRQLARCERPILLKRGPSASVKEWLLAAEYLLSGGNANVVLCERGIKTFETETRNTLDLAAVALARELSHLPVIADPSHGTGRRDLIAPASRAALAIGADG